jgi:hypothetical protein
MVESAHRYTIVQPAWRIHGFIAACSCGWESDISATAGTAGWMWDRHCESADEPFERAEEAASS